MFDLASVIVIPANQVMQMYVLWRPDFEIQPYQVFITSAIICVWGGLTVIFLNRFLPAFQTLALILLTIGGLATIITLAASADSYASNSEVWGNFEVNNLSGWAPGVAFLTGTLNGAFTMCVGPRHRPRVHADGNFAEARPMPSPTWPKNCQIREKTYQRACSHRWVLAP